MGFLDNNDVTVCYFTSWPDIAASDHSCPVIDILVIADREDMDAQPPSAPEALPGMPDLLPPIALATDNPRLLSSA
jgi:hypothetical protein